MDETPQTPKAKPANAAKPTKDQRLAQALRDNLRRRKMAGRAATGVKGPAQGADE